MKQISNLILPLLMLVAVSGRVTGQISPQSSANMDASRDVAGHSGFLVDTNRTFPILFIVGDSTVHNPGKGERGWGDVIGKNFDTNKIRVENHALGGRSSRTFQTQGWWDQVLAAAKPGDYLLVQMGHNDGGPLDDVNRARGSIRSLGEETRDIYNPIMKKQETVHTYGWYMRKYISDARAKGMVPILCTPVPHCPKDPVTAGDVEKSAYVAMSTTIAQSEHALFINLNQLAMSHYAGKTPAEIKATYFTTADNTHSSFAGAELNANCVIAGIQALTNCPLRDDLRPQP